jgi:phage-related protein
VSVNLPPKIPLVFFRTVSGTEPVREWLRGLDLEERRLIGLDLQRVQFRWPIGMPLCRPMKDGLWEVRTPLPGNRTARVMICFHDGNLYALHGFIKKTQSTRDADLQVARRRKTEVEHG